MENIIPINKQNREFVVPYSDTVDYYMISNYPFFALGQVLYYSDADYYLTVINPTGQPRGLIYRPSIDQYLTIGNPFIGEASDPYSGLTPVTIQNFKPLGVDQFSYPQRNNIASSDPRNYDYIDSAFQVAKFAKNTILPSVGGDNWLDFANSSLIQLEYILGDTSLPISKKLPYIAVLPFLQAAKHLIRPVGPKNVLNIKGSDGITKPVLYNPTNTSPKDKNYNSEITLSDTIFPIQGMGVLTNELLSQKNVALPATSLEKGRGSFKYYLDPRTKYAANDSAFYNSYKQDVVQSKGVVSRVSLTVLNHFVSDPIHSDIPSNTFGLFSKSGFLDKSPKQGMKFWIQDVSGGRVMTAPAFLTNISQQGGNAKWQQYNYLGSPYANFLYQGTQPRRLSFTLQLTCFSQETLPYYVQKLNFLRGIGFPSFVKGQPTKYYKPDGTPVPADQILQFPQATVYRLTLGDLLNQQFGFFESLQLSWDDEANFWNFNTYNDNKLNGKVQAIELPIVTSVQATFTCLYGRSPDNKHVFYKPYTYK